MNGNMDDNSGTYYHQTKRMVTHIVDHVAQRQPNNERLRMGAQMVRLGIGSIAAPIPGNVDEVVGTALVLAGAATVIDETFFR